MVRKHRPGMGRKVRSLRVVARTAPGASRPQPSPDPAPVLRLVKSSATRRVTSMDEQTKASASPADTPAPSEPAAAPGAGGFLWRTISRPPWIGLICLCVGSVIFELTLFAMLPVSLKPYDMLEMRLLLIPIAAAPAIAAIVVAIAANRRSPLASIEYPATHVRSVKPPPTREERWSEYHD